MGPRFSSSSNRWIHHWLPSDVPEHIWMAVIQTLDHSCREMFLCVSCPQMTDLNREILCVCLGLAQYSGDPRIEWHLNAFSNKEAVIDAVMNLPYKGGNTLTGCFSDLVCSEDPNQCFLCFSFLFGHHLALPAPFTFFLLLKQLTLPWYLCLPPPFSLSISLQALRWTTSWRTASSLSLALGLACPRLAS